MLFPVFCDFSMVHPMRRGDAKSNKKNRLRFSENRRMDEVMSIKSQIRYWIACDSEVCENIIDQEATTVILAKDAALEAGWISGHDFGYVGWFCPACAAKKAEG